MRQPVHAPVGFVELAIAQPEWERYARRDLEYAFVFPRR
jgi:hypothetical protein